MTDRLLLESLPPDLPPLALTMGIFDGVHRGHQALLAATVGAAQESGAVPAALTFDPHPADLLSPARIPPLLSALDERVARLHAAGAEKVIVARFTPAFAALDPETFVREVLAQKLQVRAVVVGEDFRFGCNRRGDIDGLQAAGWRFGFVVRIVPPVFLDGVPARSTAIRQMLSGGRVAEAAKLLGRPFARTGTVVRGRQLGRTLGYPTANLATPAGLLIPAPGVYAGRAECDGRWRRAAISIGTNTTVDEDTAPTVEAFLMDGFAQEIYGETLTLEFRHYLRPMERFPSLEALAVQIGRDVEETAHRIPLEERGR